MLNLFVASGGMRLRADPPGWRPAGSAMGPAVLHAAGARAAG
jgi:hypothetical protein